MNQPHYQQLGQKERDRIFLLRNRGMSQSDIASTLGRNKSTISRELGRNVHRKLHQYPPDTAQRKADRRQEAGRKQWYVDKQPRLKNRIIGLLREEDSQGQRHPQPGGHQ